MIFFEVIIESLCWYSMLWFWPIQTWDGWDRLCGSLMRVCTCDLSLRWTSLLSLMGGFADIHWLIIDLSKLKTSSTSLMRVCTCCLYSRPGPPPWHSHQQIMAGHTVWKIQFEKKYSLKKYSLKNTAWQNTVLKITLFLDIAISKLWLVTGTNFHNAVMFWS